MLKSYLCAPAGSWARRQLGSAAAGLGGSCGRWQLCSEAVALGCSGPRLQWRSPAVVLGRSCWRSAAVVPGGRSCARRQRCPVGSGGHSARGLTAQLRPAEAGYGARPWDLAQLWDAHGSIMIATYAGCHSIIEAKELVSSQGNLTQRVNMKLVMYFSNPRICRIGIAAGFMSCQQV